MENMKILDDRGTHHTREKVTYATHPNQKLKDPNIWKIIPSIKFHPQH
jgi:hypothetical protein